MRVRVRNDDQSNRNFSLNLNSYNSYLNPDLTYPLLFASHIPLRDLLRRQTKSKMKQLDLGENDFDDEVVIDFADALANNTVLNTLIIGGTDLLDKIWNALSCVLCDKSSIKNTHTSNHTLHT